jgi:hypothetical protein
MGGNKRLIATRTRCSDIGLWEEVPIAIITGDIIDVAAHVCLAIGGQ